VEEEANDWIRVFYPRQTCFIYKYALLGLYKSKVQNILTGFFILPSADNKRKDQRIQGEGTGKKEVIYQEAQHTSFWTRGLKS
jgi:hypothetical protein